MNKCKSYSKGFVEFELEDDFLERCHEQRRIIIINQHILTTTSDI